MPTRYTRDQITWNAGCCSLAGGVVFKDLVESGPETVLDLTHHSYPFGVRRDTRQEPPHPSFVDEETLVHYPGWTIAENDANVEFHVFGFDEELDATSSHRTSYWQVAVSTEEGVAVQLNFRTQIPETFSGWGANGIVLRHRILIGAGLGSPLDTGTITLEVFDPTTPVDTAEITVLRSKGADVVDDAGYVDLTVTKAQLDSMTNPFGAGDMLHVKVELFGVFGLGVHQPTFRVGRLSTHFEGPTLGSAPAAPSLACGGLTPVTTGPTFNKVATTEMNEVKWEWGAAAPGGVGAQQQQELTVLTSIPENFKRWRPSGIRLGVSFGWAGDTGGAGGSASLRVFGQEDLDGSATFFQGDVVVGTGASFSSVGTALQIDSQQLGKNWGPLSVLVIKLLVNLPDIYTSRFLAIGLLELNWE